MTFAIFAISAFSDQVFSIFSVFLIKIWFLCRNSAFSCVSDVIFVVLGVCVLLVVSVGAGWGRLEVWKS